MSAKILLLINGLGLGNSSRCHAVIQRLRNHGAEIGIVTSGNGAWYFEGRDEVSSMTTIEAISYGSKDGKLSVGSTLAKTASMVRTLKANAAKVDEAIEAFQPDAIVTDSDYTFLFHRRKQVPVFAINNADMVWRCFWQTKQKPKSIFPQFFAVESLDFLFHRMVPDRVISPHFSTKYLSRHGSYDHVGPIVREHLEEKDPEGAPENCLVMLSGSNLGTRVRFDRESFGFDVDVVGRDAPEGFEPTPSIRFHGRLRDNAHLVNEADFAVVNGGYSAVSELFWLKKPMIVVPVAKHSEQWTNAYVIEEMGLGILGSEESYQKDMLDLRDRFRHFKDAYAALPDMEDGAEQAAKIILSG